MCRRALVAVRSVAVRSVATPLSALPRRLARGLARYKGKSLMPRANMRHGPLAKQLNECARDGNVAGALALFGTEFGSALLGSKHGFLRYFGEGEPSVAIQQYSEAFGIGLLVLAAQTFDIATNGDDGAKER